MAFSRREFMIQAAASAAALLLLEEVGKAANLKATAAAAAKVSGPFEPTWDSLSQYEFPEWFQDAKFGMWAHWNAQCVPEVDSWYAQRMYNQGSTAYDYHCATYGHPSKIGFKEINRMWKAENWDPAYIVNLYKEAGAKYFFALANHQCALRRTLPAG